MMSFLNLAIVVVFLVGLVSLCYFFWKTFAYLFKIIRSKFNKNNEVKSPKIKNYDYKIVGDDDDLIQHNKKCDSECVKIVIIRFL